MITLSCGFMFPVVAQKTKEKNKIAESMHGTSKAASDDGAKRKANCIVIPDIFADVC